MSENLPDCLYTERPSIYTHDELNFPTTGIPFPANEETRTRPYIVFNMVASVDGKATTHEGKLTGLGSRMDRRIMQRLRSQVDGVLVGGNTLCVDPFIPTLPADLVAERSPYFPDRPQPLGMVVSNSGDLPHQHRFWEAGPDLRVVFLNETATTEVAEALAKQATVIRIPNQPGKNSLDLARVLDVLYQQLGVKRLLVEGGPSLNYEFISHGWGDEIFLTLSPRLVGGQENFTPIAGAGYGMGTGKLPHLQLRSLYHYDSELFLRYQIRY